MGLPETASECLCPLDSGESTDSVNAVDTRVKSRQPHHNSHFNKINRNRAQRQPQPTTPPQPLLRRSKTFYEGGNAQQCIEACRRGFLSALTLTTTPSPLPLPSVSSAGIVNSDDGVSLPAACSALSGADVQQDLWQLYWCDSAFCGVWIEADGGFGQDPNVDLFINECQNIGYYSVLDPGPPPSDYYCSSLLTAGPSGNPCQNLVQTPSQTASTAIVSSNNLAAPPATAAPTVAATETGTDATTTSSQQTLPTVAPASGITSTSSANTMHSTPTPGAKAAIAVCSIFAAALLAALVFFFVKKRRNGISGQPYQHRSSMGGPGGGVIGSDLNDDISTVGDASHANADEFVQQISRGKRDSFGLARSSGPIGLKTRLRQSQMLFLPGHFRGAASAQRSRNERHPRQSGDELPTPLISSTNSCNSAPGVINATSSYKLDSAQTQTQKKSARSQWPFLFPSSLFSRRSRYDRSISPPLTSLSPPPSPTQLSARGSGAEQADIYSNSNNNNNMYYGYNGSPVPYYFPSSPICAPTTNKLEPRAERTPTIKSNKSASSLKGAAAKPKPPQALGYYNFQSNRNNQQPPVPALPQTYRSPLDRHSAAESAGSARGLRSSYGSYSTATNASIPASSLYGNALTTNMMEPMTPIPGLPQPPSPASPARPPRPHESPLEIPDLVMPDPPPLPPPPRGSMSNKNTSRSFSMPASAFSFSSVGGRKNLSIAHPPPLPTMTLSAPPPLPEHVVYANSLDSFSTHSGAIANYSASGTSPQANKARLNTKEPILSAGTPPNRALPSPPPPPPVPPMSSKRLSTTASLASMARSLSVSPQPQRSIREHAESVASSFELPPLLVRDDHDDDSLWQGKQDGDADISSSANTKTSKDTVVPSKGQTSSISSTMSASSMLSSNTADTMASLASMATMATMTTSSTVNTTATATADPVDVFKIPSSLVKAPEVDNNILATQTSV